MGWTEFSAIMDDNMEFCFGTPFDTMFFDMPEGYTADRIKRIVPAERSKAKGANAVYREKPYFDCYLCDKQIT